MLKALMSCIVGLAFLAWPGEARALVIGFEIPTGGGGNDFIASYSEAGFSFTSDHLHYLDSPGVCGGTCSDNGTNYLASEAGQQSITMTTAGAPFTLIAFDAAELFTGVQAFQLNVTGTLFGGGFVNASFLLDGINDGTGPLVDFQTFALPSTFTNLTQVLFGGNGTITAIDNVVVNEAVPEPSTLGLIGLGLVGLGAMARRRARVPR